jgi:DNA-binding Lrp family transcriptional regulator
MEKLDLKNRKILFQLIINSRQSFSQIGKKVGLHKDVVAYRVKSLIEKGIIKSFTSIIDPRSLGFISVRYYLTFQFINPEVKKEIIDYFIKSPIVTDVLSADGDFDLVVILTVRDIYDSFDYWEKTMLKYREYFADQIFSIYVKQQIFYGSSILSSCSELDNLKKDIKTVITGDIKKTEIDGLDKQILKLITDNSRMSTIDISEKLNTTSITINNRIKSLINKGIIKIFSLHYIYHAIGINWYKVFIFFKDLKKTDKIIEYLKNNKHLAAVDKVLGYDDLELQFYFSDTNQLHQTMEDLSAKFPNAIRFYKYFNIKESYKARDFTEII